MKRISKFIAVFALIALPLLLTAGSRDAGAAETKKAKTIDELAAMYDSSSCKQCHEEIYNDWNKSLHARSIFGTGRTAATIKTTVEVGLKGWKYSGVKKAEDVELRHLMVCAKCHLPQLADATDAVAKEIVKAAYTYADPKTSDSEREKAIAKLEKVNINCLICHQRNAITHKWVDGTPDRKTVYGTKDGSHPSPGHPKMKTSLIMGESILCGQCHGQGPNFELENPSQCATLYGSYLFSYIHEGGQQSCQECHMKKSKLGHNMQSYRSKALTDMALDFSVEMLPHQWRDGSKMVPETRVIVNMKNKAGHAIPDG
jgi:hypothetical protein